MNQIAPATQNLARWLLTHEATLAPCCQGQECEVFHACEKLRQPLSALAGVDGFRSLLSRALALTKAQFPGLNALQIKHDGSLEWRDAAPRLEPQEAAKAAEALLAQLLGLLITFIGQPLMLRLVRDVWPDAPFDDMDSGTER